jgi:hypothetical protein
LLKQIARFVAPLQIRFCLEQRVGIGRLVSRELQALMRGSARAIQKQRVHCGMDGLPW